MNVLKTIIVIAILLFVMWLAYQVLKVLLPLIFIAIVIFVVYVYLKRKGRVRF